MKEYPHIDSVYKRDERGKFIMGEFSAPEFEYLKDLPWTWTEKIDGTNIRIMWKGLGEFPILGGKTDNAQLPTKLVQNLNAEGKITADKFAEVFPDGHDICLYGEGYGAGIQKGGGLYSAEQKFILFDVKIGDWWLLRKDVEDIAAKLGLDVVPIRMRATTLTDVIEGINKIAQGEIEHPASAIGGNNLPLIEGYVGQPSTPLRNRKGERIITKIKVKDFK